MSTVGQVERKTQQRVVNLFRDTLGYDYLGDWTDRAGNRNVEEDLLRKFLREQQGYDEALITRALHLLDKAAGERGCPPAGGAGGQRRSDHALLADRRAHPSGHPPEQAGGVRR